MQPTIPIFFKKLDGPEHAHLRDELHAMSQKAGVETPALFKVDHATLEELLKTVDHPQARMNLQLWHQGIPAAAFRAPEGAGVVISEKMLHLSDMKNLESPMSDKLRAVFYHELGHVKRGDIAKGPMLLKISPAPMAGFAAGIAVMACLHYYWSTKEKAAQTATTGHPSEQPHAVHAPTHSAAAQIGQYLLAGLLGAGGGLFIATKMRHQMEYACDAFSKEMMGTGEPLAAFFDSFKTYATELKNALYEQHHFSKKQSGALDSMNTFFERLMHPAIDARVSRLRG